MGLSDAKRLLQWNVVTEALTAAGVDAEIMEMVENARASSETVSMMGRTLLGGADVKQAKNYVKCDLVGMIPPFERAYVELVRPGGKTSHELRLLLRDRLEHVRRLLDGVRLDSKDALREGLIQGIDEDLATEAP